jgi:hypothetical protein
MKVRCSYCGEEEEKFLVVSKTDEINAHPRAFKFWIIYPEEKKSEVQRKQIYCCNCFYLLWSFKQDVKPLLRSRFKLQRKVIDAYGGKCLCCGCTYSDILFITGDKSNLEHWCWGQYPLYLYLSQHGYPAGFYVFCRNCYNALYRFGICPHQEKPTAVSWEDRTAKKRSRREITKLQIDIQNCKKELQNKKVALKRLGKKGSKQ